MASFKLKDWTLIICEILLTTFLCNCTYQKGSLPVPQIPSESWKPIVQNWLPLVLLKIPRRRGGTGGNETNAIDSNIWRANERVDLLKTYLHKSCPRPKWNFWCKHIRVLSELWSVAMRSTKVYKVGFPRLPPSPCRVSWKHSMLSLFKIFDMSSLLKK